MNSSSISLLLYTMTGYALLEDIDLIVDLNS